MNRFRSHEFIEALARAATVEELHDVCGQFCDEHGFEHFIYAAMIPTSLTKPYFIYISGYPKDWRDHYNARGYAGIDPTVAHCASRITPLLWEEIGVGQGRTAPVRDFLGEAADFGLNSGVSFPVHSAQGESGMLSLASGQPHGVIKPSAATVMPLGHLFTAYLHENVRRVFSESLLPVTQVQLTEREKQCLLWAAEGKTSWETAQILGISERTVLFHTQNASDKLNVVNRSQAVARAITTGLITPQFS